MAVQYSLFIFLEETDPSKTPEIQRRKKRDWKAKEGRWNQVNTFIRLRYSATAERAATESFRAASSHTQQCTPLLPE